MIYRGLVKRGEITFFTKRKPCRINVRKKVTKTRINIKVMW